MKALTNTPDSAKDEAQIENVPAKRSGMDNQWALYRRLKAQVETLEAGITTLRRDVYRIEHKQRDMAKEAPSQEIKDGPAKQAVGAYALPDPFIR